MIDPKELRIGNYVYDTLGEPNILGFQGMKYVMKEPTNNQLEPIPITEEWLLRFGFEKDSIGYFISNDTHTYMYNLVNNLFYNIDGFRYDISMPIKYIHQLQNLYYALTGEELKEVNNKSN